PQSFEPLTEAGILGGRCWTIPVLYKGRIYARNLGRVVCFSLVD
ncbi:MAG: alcohol dehydrogenase, partial [Planctomycetes bacterium]|nr:alcohol dehydrogenase [Planctomycetota bacterium]